MMSKIMQEMPLERNSVCKISSGAYPQTPLQACALGTCVSMLKNTPYFPSKRGWNLCEDEALSNGSDKKERTKRNEHVGEGVEIQ